MREALVLAFAFGAGAVLCLIGGISPDNDPLLVAELVAGSLALGWGVTVARHLLIARRLARRLDELSERRVIDGVDVNVIPADGRFAFVLGAARPKIYVSEELLSSLQPDERRAVLLHEHHHQATRAPLRAAALESWIFVIGRVQRLRRRLLERLGDLEAMADSYAIARGCTRGALAGALLKTDASIVGVSAVSYGADRRIAALLEGKGATTVRHHLPYEWLPAAVMLTVALACHSFEVALP